MLVSVLFNSYSLISWLENLLGYGGPNIQILGNKARFGIGASSAVLLEAGLLPILDAGVLDVN